MTCMADTVREPLHSEDPIMRFLDFWQREKKPVSVLFEVTARCNLRCRHCYQQGLRPVEEMSLSMIRDVFTQIADTGVLFMGITGGEPFVREDIIDIVATAKHHRFFVTLLTNGTLIDAKSARELARLGVERVEVSFHGPTADLHEKITGIPGSFEAFLRGLENLQKTDLRVALKSTITTLNVGAMDAMKAFAASRSLSLQCDPKILPSLDGGRDPLQVRLEPDEYPDELWAELWGESAISETSYTVGTNSSGFPHLGQPDDDTQICKAGVVSCAVRPSGRVSPCIVLPITVGDLRQDSFATIWNGPGMEEHRKLTFSSYPKCRKCDTFYQCFRCPAYALLEEGDILKMPEFLCRSASCSRDYLQETARKKRTEHNVSR